MFINIFFAFIIEGKTQVFCNRASYIYRENFVNYACVKYKWNAKNMK